MIFEILATILLVMMIWDQAKSENKLKELDRKISILKDIAVGARDSGYSRHKLIIGLINYFDLEMKFQPESFFKKKKK